jgi:alkylhydroperoxidase family enzyme
VRQQLRVARSCRSPAHRGCRTREASPLFHVEAEVVGSITLGAALREALGDPILADRITLDHRRASLDERRTAILDFAIKSTKEPPEYTPRDLATLRGFGPTEEELWDVVEKASMYDFTNRMSLACSMIPNEEYHTLAL